MQSPFAYLDAGSGSMILQIILGGFAAIAVSMKLYWRRITTFLRIRKPEPESEATSEPAPAPSVAERAEDERATVKTSGG
jgi:hypothetical protein